ncbi:MAG: hypothetical protein K2K44_00555, partial [Oscillospiraceae bacterium]|nr:hypothetical protein [Oscillospiraceae bacterium]
MAKKYKLILVMSIISFVLSAVSWYFYVINIGGFPAEIVLFHAITAILGILGLINFFVKGKVAFGCLITAMVVSAGYTLIS